MGDVLKKAHHQKNFSGITKKKRKERKGKGREEKNSWFCLQSSFQD